MVFQKKEEKTPNRKPKHPLSAFQTSKIIVNVVVRISHAKAVSRAASVCSSSMFAWQWEKFGFRREPDGWLGCWKLPYKQLQHQNGTFGTNFCICFSTVRDISHPCYWNQRMAANVTRAIYCHILCIWVLARDIFNHQETFQLSVGQKKRHFAIQKELQQVPVPDITQHTPEEPNHTKIT